MRRSTKISSSPKIIERDSLSDEFLQIYEVAVREEDQLAVEMSRCAGHYSLLVKLSEKSIERVVRVNPDFDVDTASYELARFDPDSVTLTTYPLTLASNSKYFLTPRYKLVRSIAFEGQGAVFDGEGDVSLEFEDLPLGFVRDMFAGFGVNYEYRFIIEALERVASVIAIVMCEDSDASINNGILRLPYDTFDKWRRALRRGHNVAVVFGNRSKTAYLRDQIAEELGLHPQRPASVAPIDELADAMVSALELPGRKRPIAAATAALAAKRTESRKLADSEKTELIELNREIELLTLEQLISRLEDHLAKNHAESFWQRFFSDNPFILRLAFGLPIAVFGEQVSVGGNKFDGSGGKIADYVVKAGHFGNLAIIEIKTPQTPLFEARAYRGGVQAPTKHLSGAVTQILDQRYQLQISINDRKIASGAYDVHSFAIQGLVIAGRDPVGLAQKKSLELFRNGLKDVTIVTFDELLAKLRALHRFLSGTGEVT